ncbi:L-lactate dehydrogenase [Hominiventricola filiformis]|uniref:L-lactate dehydrogenase n=1 Tax=Hominiventricola filiformis TaxID=2885352 RepID=A0AAE3DC92_9FIRM|nr:L-lactate dehydrogenase [Hominiventricola filiformis]MCC2126124.1 L-lactate dehydrogenase [Hominiventricola filiformis]
MGKVSYGKMVIIGAGNVGSAILNSVLRMNILDNIVVVNRNQKKALGEVLDASHTTAFAYSANADIRVGGYEECADAQIIVITAGPSIQPGNSRDRMVLLEKNVSVMNDIMEQITRYTREAIIIVVSNPLDILTYIAQKKFNYPANKIFGTGTLLDTARFNKMLGDLCGVDAKNVTGFVLGEHGSTSFIPWNTVNIVGVPFDQLKEQFNLEEQPDKEKLLHDTKVIGLDIVELKGYTSSGVALSACRLIGSIVRNEKSVVPVSTVLSGQYGMTGVAMSLPCVISKNGIDRVLELPLDENGKKDLENCYEHLRTAITSVYPKEKNL